MTTTETEFLVKDALTVARRGWVVVATIERVTAAGQSIWVVFNDRVEYMTTQLSAEAAARYVDAMPTPS